MEEGRFLLKIFDVKLDLYYCFSYLLKKFVLFSYGNFVKEDVHCT